MPELTPSSEDYLEAIYRLADEHDAVRSVDIADHLNVSKASVNKAVHVLKDAGLIDHAHYGQIHLTEAGRKRAADISQRHRMLKRFLTEVLQIDEKTAEEDACRMEHAISEQTRDHWLAWLEDVLET